MVSDWITMTFGMKGYLVFAALFPIYSPVEWADDPDRVLDYVRLPFFIVLPLRLWRKIQIRYLTWVVCNRDMVSN